MSSKSKMKFSFNWVMGFYTTLNNISVISWRSVLLVEKTGVPGENHQHIAMLDWLCLNSILIFRPLKNSNAHDLITYLIMNLSQKNYKKDIVVNVRRRFHFTCPTCSEQAEQSQHLIKSFSLTHDIITIRNFMMENKSKDTCNLTKRVLGSSLLFGFVIFYNNKEFTDGTHVTFWLRLIKILSYKNPCIAKYFPIVKTN
jgi:hypothetical protein